ncbi:AfsR/SARP family transcriptional regulator [Kribbella turkmenica]|uniref:AfsR/SARP family transcriptional regulator n=1 Tax=Kribbella turkmenica TaxID=2530375 RepID=UPI001404A4E7|nr:AfsR/SARP family transcriptional regulator [Kribbella turkmenica]
MRFFVLGPIQLRVSGAPSPTAPTLRVLLGCLLARPDAPVPFDELIDALWGDKPVRNARQRLHVHVHRLRRLLGDPARIACEHATYRLRLQPGELDAETFESLLDEAGASARAGDDERAAATIREALELWEGPAYAGLDHVELLRAEADRLTERRLVAFEDLCAAELAAGRGSAMIAELRDLAAQHPLRERLQEQLMIALYRAGQQASALEVYRRTRTALVDELGVEPGPRLAELHAAVLAADPALAPTPERTRDRVDPHPGNRTTAPAQLPAAIADFTGRDKQLALIQDLAAHDAGPAGTDAGVTPVLAISGPAGIGKTALAICAAHRLRGAYPDGQLYVDLRGAEAVALDAGDVLAGFLRALGTAAEAIPDRTEERATLFRSLLADSRILVLLDNANSEEQVRRLIPAARGCLVLITSRTPLGGLEGSRLIDLERFDQEQALELLARVAGRERVAAEPRAAAGIVELCGLLPLAVRIAAARLAIRPDWALGQLESRLADECRRLDELRLGDLAVRASLASSMQDLRPAARKAFRRLGLLDTPQVPAWLAASVLDQATRDSEHILDQLVDAQLLELVQADGPPRYRLHDLVRLYAGERAQDEEPHSAGVLERASSAALARTIAAIRGLEFGPSRPAALDDHGKLLPPADPLGWLETERTVLVSIVRQAADAGLADAACALASTLTPFLDTRAQYDDWRRTHEAALAAARRLGDDRGIGWMSVKLAELARIHDDFAGSLELLDQASSAFLAAPDGVGEAEVRLQTGMTYRALGRPHCALSSFDEAQLRYGELGDDHGVALARLNVGAAYLDLRRQGDARAHLTSALTAFRAHADRRNLALALRWIGVCDRYDGRYVDAETRLIESRATFEALGDTHNAAFVLGDLGRLCLALGRCVDARKLFEDSLAGFRTYRDRHGEARALHDIGIVQQRRARHHLAARYLRDAVRIWRELGVRLWHERSLRSLRVSLLATGDTTGARTAAESADSLAREVGEQRSFIPL